MRALLTTLTLVAACNRLEPYDLKGIRGSELPRALVTVHDDTFTATLLRANHRTANDGSCFGVKRWLLLDEHHHNSTTRQLEVLFRATPEETAAIELTPYGQQHPFLTVPFPGAVVAATPTSVATARFELHDTELHVTYEGITAEPADVPSAVTFVVHGHDVARFLRDNSAGDYSHQEHPLELGTHAQDPRYSADGLPLCNRRRPSVRPRGLGEPGTPRDTDDTD